jgi:hypothetical protein
LLLILLSGYLTSKQGIVVKRSEGFSTTHLKPLLPISSLVAAGLWAAILPTNAQVNVTQYHNHSSRDGLYIDPAFTQSAAANLTRDLNFDGTIVGNVYAQPLYVEGGPNGPMIIAVTESNNVYALDAMDGSIIWQRNVGAPVPAPDLTCTEVGSMGIISTPVVDLASRALFLDAMVTPDGGNTIKHYIISLNVDTGAINSGWPVDVEATAQYNGTTFTAAIQQQRAALGIVGNILYVGYGSMGDCSVYHGWVVGVPINNPASVTAWAAGTIGPGIWGGAIWGVGGIASDGTNPFVTTGNTIFTGGVWCGGEAVIRFQPGPIFSDSRSDYWAPTNWFVALDNEDLDLGGSGPLLVDVPRRDTVQSRGNPALGTQFDAPTYVLLLLDFDDHKGTIALDSIRKSHANKPQEPFKSRQQWLADRTGRAQMGLADTTGNISSAHISSVSRTGGGNACLSSESKRQWPLRGGQQ